jgi:pimeloyl-ACP methyl ester carboxylesterase
MRSFLLMAAVLLASAGPAPSRIEVQSGAARISVITQGQGPLVVMLPSRGRDSEDYGAVAAAIAAQGFRVLRPQPRGSDGSTGPLEDLTLHDYANDVAQVIEAAHDGPAVLVGHAYGNWVARMTAVDHPGLVRGVVLAASAAKAYPKGLSEIVTKSADMSLPEAERRAYLQQAFFAAGHDPESWLTGWWPEASRSQAEAAARVQQSDWWSGGSAPLLDLIAANDPFRPESSWQDLKRQFADRVTVVVIEDASHALMPEQPAAVADAIVAWMRRLPPASG